MLPFLTHFILEKARNIEKDIYEENIIHNYSRELNRHFSKIFTKLPHSSVFVIYFVFPAPIQTSFDGYLIMIHQILLTTQKLSRTFLLCSILFQMSMQPPSKFLELPQNRLLNDKNKFILNFVAKISMWYFIIDLHRRFITKNEK